jgi:hypothetical protein
MPIGKDEILNRWGYHPPADAVNVRRHEQVREAYIAFAEYLDLILPDGRSKSSAFTKLQESSMWANYGIAALSPAVEPVRPDTVLNAPETGYVEEQTE